MVPVVAPVGYATSRIRGGGNLREKVARAYRLA
jgi:hypothetical protein